MEWNEGFLTNCENWESGKAIDSSFKVLSQNVTCKYVKTHENIKDKPLNFHRQYHINMYLELKHNNGLIFWMYQILLRACN